MRKADGTENRYAEGAINWAQDVAKGAEDGIWPEGLSANQSELTAYSCQSVCMKYHPILRAPLPLSTLQIKVIKERGQGSRCQCLA